MQQGTRNVFQRMQPLYYLLMAFLVVACSSSLAQPIELEPFVSGIEQPTTITNAGDGSGRLFVTSKTGQIHVIEGGKVLDTPFLDISEQITTNNERGLLGLAFHPNYEENGRFFINYTNLDGDTVIAEYSVSDDPNVADASSEQILLTIEQPQSNHNGGQLAFGPDGYLYIGTGDGGGGGDDHGEIGNGQSLDTLLGKILRIDVDSGDPYAIPADNPFANSDEALPEIWAYGLRNPWRFSFDRETGDLWIADVGQNAWEEVNFQPADSPGGENYGWRLMEGTHCFNPPENCNDGTLVLPVLEYSHDVGSSITGGYVYRGSAYPELVGTYFFGDYVSGRLWGATQNSEGEWSMEQLLDTKLNIVAFGEDEAGELYVADFAGDIYRVKGSDAE